MRQGTSQSCQFILADDYEQSCEASINFSEGATTMGATVSTTVTIRSSGKDKELEHKAKMQKVAELIVGGDAAPSWPRDVLSDLSFEVISAHSIETLLPTKKGLSDDLAAIEKYALKLVRLLQSTMTPGFIVTGAGKESESYINDGLGFLSVLATDVRKAKTSPRLVTSEGEVLQQVECWPP